jgi:hypothetical protein
MLVKGVQLQRHQEHQVSFKFSRGDLEHFLSVALRIP